MANDLKKSKQSLVLITSSPNKGSLYFFRSFLTYLFFHSSHQQIFFKINQEENSTPRVNRISYPECADSEVPILPITKSSLVCLAFAGENIESKEHRRFSLGSVSTSKDNCLLTCLVLVGEISRFGSFSEEQP